jgi:ubiquinone/menaquinone biosynthesis C-methylase UbiE
MDLKAKPEEYFSGHRPEMLVYIPVHSKRILEIGCGEGNFGAILKKKLGAEVWGVEYESSQAEMAMAKLDKVFSGDISGLLDQLPGKYFDAIICNDVLEHLTDPYTVLEKLRINLSPQGVMICSLPNIRFFRTFFDFVLHKNWDYTDNGIMDKTHYRFFTVKSIPKMFVNAGYDVLTLEGINPTKSIRPLLWNLLFLGFFSDIKFRQFAVVARARD